ncbi:MAG: hypothetical protein NDI67_12425 [Sulfuritalea sp.]|nr:hypothetical protein [Sulfuritalea sp.]
MENNPTGNGIRARRRRPLLAAQQSARRRCTVRSSALSAHLRQGVDAARELPRICLRHIRKTSSQIEIIRYA